MVKKLLQKALNLAQSNAKEPWASFEIVGFEKDGRIKVITSWNKAFIKAIYALGFQAETEEDSVQLFFYTAQARPTEFDGAEENPAISSGHPNLASDTHQLRT
jgi:hypothetical protein